MPIKVNCPQCQASSYVADNATGAKVKCRSCNAVFQVPAPGKRTCTTCGVDLSSQKRVKDEHGRYYCHPCWATHHGGATAESSLDGKPLNLLEALDSQQQGPSATGNAPLAWCPQCRQPFFGTDRQYAGGICRRCFNRRIVRWTGLVLGAAAAIVAIVIGVRFATDRFGKSSVATSDQSDPATQRPAQTQKAARPDELPPDPANDTAEQEMQRFFVSALAASKNADYGQLLKVYHRRRELLSKNVATPGLMSDWLADQRVIDQARSLVCKTKYADAVKVLRDRIARRYGNLSAAPSAPINGELGVALVEAALASAVVEDRWQMQRDEMVQVLRFVAEHDPACVKATVMLAWLVYAAPSEELLRLDARPSVLTRNQLLLPIRTSLAGLIADYEKETDFEAFQQKLSQHPQVPPALFREIMGPLDYSLALSRKRVEEEYMLWTQFLREPRFLLKDRANNTYRMVRGILWKQAQRPEGGYEWQLMVPPAPGQKQWTPLGLSFLRWSRPDMANAGMDPRLEAMYRRFDREKPLPVDFPAVNQRTLAAFGSRGARVEELFELSIPICFLSLQAVRQGWDSAAASDQFKGSHLLLNPALAREIFGADLLAAPGARGPQIAVGLSPIVAVLERLEPVNLELFSSESGAPYFISTVLGRSDGGRGSMLPGRQQRLYLREGTSLSFQTPGGGSIGLMFYGSQLNAQAQRQSVSRLLRWIKNDPAWEAVQKLRSQLQEFAGGSGKSADDMLLDAIVGGADLPKPANWDEASRPWLIEYARYMNTVQDVRRLLARYPHGFCRNRLVRLRAPAGGGGARFDELQFLDENGDEAPQFYTANPNDPGDRVGELTKLRTDAFADFNLPSDLAVPSPAVAEATGLLGSPQAYVLRRVQKLVHARDEQTAEAVYNTLHMPLPFRDNSRVGIVGFLEIVQRAASLRPNYPQFMLARAYKAKQAGDYHLAAALYRELILPPFAFDAFDSTKPLNRDEFEMLLSGMAERAMYGQIKMEARLSHAEVLERADRRDMGAAVRWTALSEWEVAGLPLLDDLRRYSEAYAYSAKPGFNEACRQIRQRVNSTPRIAIRPPAAMKPAPFSPPGASPEKALETFYDSRPTLEEYRKAKQWVLRNNPRILRRQPRTDAEQFLLFWNPIALRGERLKSLNEQELFGQPEGADKLADRWREVIHAIETADVRDFSYARQLLIDFAAAERRAAADSVSPQQGGPLSRTALAHSLNAITSIALACTLDQHLPMGYGPARFEPFVLESAQLELETFVKHRLVAAGLNMAQIGDLLDPVRNILQTAIAAPDDYPERRYYWTEYAPLVDDYRSFSRSAAQ